MRNKTTPISKADFFDQSRAEVILFTMIFFLTFKDAKLFKWIIFLMRIGMREEVMEAIVIRSKSAEL